MPRGEILARWLARLVFVASAALVVDAATTHMALPPVHPLRQYHFFDLRIYRQAALVVSHGARLYMARLRFGLGFTYPPFAVLLFIPLTWLSLHHVEQLALYANIVLMAMAAHAALRLRRYPASAQPASEPLTARQQFSSGQQFGLSRWLAVRPGAWSSGGRAAVRWSGGRAAVRWSGGRAAARWLLVGGSATGWLVAAAALWCEPVVSAIGYGQIDPLIAALVIADLAYGRRSRAGGIGIGLAAALKLTPLIFILYLAFTARGRMAGRALATFLLSIVVALVALPSDTIKYWSGTFVDISRVTGHNHHPGAGPANQSLRGTVLRLFLGAHDATAIWILAALLIGACGLLLAVRAARRGDEAWGFLLAAITGVLISPVSWTHHWTIVVPGVLALMASQRRPLRGVLCATIVAALALGGYQIWPLILKHQLGVHLGLRGFLFGNLYVLAGLAAIASAALMDLRRVAAQRQLKTHRPIITRVPLAAGSPVAPTPAPAGALVAADRRSL